MAQQTTSNRLGVAGLLLGLVLVAPIGCDRDDPTSAGRTPALPEVWFPPVCIGTEPPAEAWSDSPGGAPSPGDAGTEDVQPELGAPAPEWRLSDFQPQSCGYEAVYGLEAFRGLVTVVAIWSGS